MKKQFLTLALASLTALLVAQSPPPPPAPTKPSQEQQDDRALNSRKTEDAKSPAPTPVATVNQATASPTEKQAQRQGGVKRKDAAVNWSLVNTVLLTAFNLLLVVVGFLQWNSMRNQAAHMREGLAETKRAANAADTSATAATEAVENAKNALRVTERALVKIESVILRGDATRFEESTAVHIKLKNFGRTVAYSVIVTGSLESEGKRKELSETPAIMMAPQGHNYWTSHSLGYFLEPSDIQAIADTTAGLAYEIVVTYIDVFKDKHTYKASGRWSPALRRFNIASDSSD